MIVNSAQKVQVSNPLDTSSPRRVDDNSRSSNVDPQDKAAVAKQKQQSDAVVRELRARDREVRAHESAHVSVGGSLVLSGPTFTFQTGPDGRSYAIGGEVKLDVSPVANDPAATVDKAGLIRAAALAPAKPSPQDLSVAANANKLAARARVDLAILRRDEAELDREQEQLNNASDTNDVSDSSANNASTESQTDIPLAPASSVDSANLQSIEPPATAINAFKSITQPESAPALVNQFV